MNRRQHVMRGLGAAGIVAAALVGCATALPEPRPAAEPAEPLPALTVAQVDDVLAAVGDAVAAADEARTPDALLPRAADPALRLRTAQYTLSARSDGERTPTSFATTDQFLAVGASEEWPRTIMAVTEPPEGETAPLLLVLRQDEPRAQYKLVSWVVLFPGVEIPAVPAPETGTAQLPPDAEGLLATPAETLARYADVLAKGTESEHADLFGANPYVDQLQEELATSRASLEGIAQISLNASTGPEEPVALATADGGALVVGVVETVTDYIKTLDGSTVRLGSAAGAWLRGGEISSRANVRHQAMVAFHVPPEDGENITVLGAEPVLVDASKA